jgi:hypothetical protein
VFGTPIWISTFYAITRRSARDDFGIAYNLEGTIPIVIAECCTFIMKSSKSTPPANVEMVTNVLSGQVDGPKDLSCFSTSAVQEGQERIGALVSTFESPPMYGAGLDWNGYDYSQAGTTLMHYLLSLPQAIIPRDIVMLLQRSAPRTSSVVRLQRYLVELRKLPWLNRDTLFYLLAFFVSLRRRATYGISPELAHIFQPIIMTSNRSSSLGYSNILHFLIENAEHILADSIVSSQETTRPQYAKAIYSYDEHKGGRAGDLFFRKGDEIRVAERPDDNDGWWTGKLNGKQGIFPKSYVTHPDYVGTEIEGDATES